MQTFQYTPYAYPLAIAAFLSALLTFYMWERRHTSGAKPAAVLMLALFVWSAGYCLEFLGADLQTKLFWAKIQYIGIVTIPAALFLFALVFSGRRSWVTIPRLAGLMVIPVITLLLAVTNDLHRQVWSDWYLDTIGGTSVLHLEHGVAFWVYIVYSYILLVASTIFIIQALIHRPKVYRGQMVSIAIGIAAPWIGNLLSISGLYPHPIDLTPFAFIVTGVVIAWSMYRHNLLDIAPIGFETVIENVIRP